MIINGTMSDIKVKRTRNLLRPATEVSCSQYCIKGNFDPYDRLEDFLWRIFSEKVIPDALNGAVDGDAHDKFLVDTDMLPACLTRLYENDEEKRFLLTCMDKQLTTTYQIWFSSDDMFRQSAYELRIANISIEVKDCVKEENRTFSPEGITERGFGVYQNISEAIWDALEDAVVLEFSGTENEDDAMFYVIPDWVDKKSLMVRTNKLNEQYQWTCKSPDEMFTVKATFNLKIS